MSPPIGGKFLTYDSIFSEDEKYGSDSTSSSIQQTDYLAASLCSQPQGPSVSTLWRIRSLCRTLKCLPMHNVVSFCLSAVSPDTLYIATSSGAILSFNWRTAEKIGNWQQVKGHATTIHAIQLEGSDHDTLFAVCKKPSATQGYHLSYLIPDAHIKDRWKHKYVWENSDCVHRMQILGHGTVILAATDSKIAIGVLKTKQNKEDPPVAGMAYEWQTFRCSEPITTFAAQSRQKHSGTSRKRKQSTSPLELNVDIALGTLSGSIFVYEDILSKLENMATSDAGDKAAGPTPRKLHWHREAVAALKWSLDGKNPSTHSQTLLTRSRQLLDLRWQ